MTRKLFLISVLLPLLTHAQSNSPKLSKPTGEPNATLVNVNDISAWIRSDGLSGNNPYTQGTGVIYPRGTAGVVFSDGILWGGFVKDGQSPELRVGGQRYTSGTVPGRIISKGVPEDPNDPDVRIWRIRRDWQTADLTQDAAEFFNLPVDSVIQDQIDAIRTQYAKDWNEWPWQKGAPFYDANDNGIMDGAEEPGLAYADQVVWFVANDLDATATQNLYGSPPVGFEMQVTLWAYNRTGDTEGFALQNAIFRRYRLIYKGTDVTPDTARIDSMFFAIVSDPDLGEYSDDYAGCDTTLNTMFVYNSKRDPEFHTHNLPPPAVGYALLQGPLVYTGDPGDVGIFDMKERPSYKNLEMTTFNYIPASSYLEPDRAYYPGTEQWYKLMNGFFSRAETPFIDADGQPGLPCVLSGDPVTGTGMLDGNMSPAGDRRIQMMTGPINMALDDTQEVVIALVGGIGENRLDSITKMKYFISWTHFLAVVNFDIGFEEQPEPEDQQPEFYFLSQNYPNPFNAITEIRYELPVQRNIRLIVYNLLGQKVKTLVDEDQTPKQYVVQWNGTDDHGKKVPSGIYLCRMEAGSFIRTRKMIVLE